MEMAQKLCLLETIRKFTSMTVQFKHQSLPRQCCRENVQTEHIPYLSSLFKRYTAFIIAELKFCRYNVNLFMFYWKCCLYFNIKCS